MKKQIFNKEFYSLVSSISSAMTRGRQTLFFKKVANHDRILSVLVREGFIISYQTHKMFIFIRLNAPKSSATFVERAKRIARRNFSISLSELRSLHIRNGGIPNLVLSTDLGILSSVDAVEKGVGGRILFKIS